MKDKITFSEKAKKEICSLSFEDHCLKALLSSFINNRLTVILKSNDIVWRLSSQFDFIMEFIEHAFKTLYDVQITKQYSKTATNINGETNYIEIKGNFDLIRSDLCLNSDLDRNQLWELECCKRAYIAGAFLACGSVSSLEAKSYHLEIRSSNYKYLTYLQSLLILFNIFPVLSKHSKKLFILYIKKADQISDFLKLIGANEAMLEFEDNKISKDFNMNVTRLNNLDISNMAKTSQASHKQIQQINQIKNLNIYKQQKDKFKAFCELRLANPEASLSQLTELMLSQYNIEITRAGLNHLIRKLDLLAKESEKK